MLIFYNIATSSIKESCLRNDDGPISCNLNEKMIITNCNLMKVCEQHKDY